MVDKPIIVTDNIASTTTVEEDKHTKSARFNDSIWEFTQSFIAVVVILAVVHTNAYLSLYGSNSTNDISTSALMQINVLGGIIVGFYFGRTNHARSGGVMQKKVD